MEIPKDDLVRDLYEKLDDSLKEFFQDRAAIIEFEGQRTRADAEFLAMLIIIKRYPLAITGIRGIWIEVDGEARVLFATDLNNAREHVARLGGRELGPIDLADAVTTIGGGVLILGVWHEPQC